MILAMLFVGFLGASLPFTAALILQRQKLKDLVMKNQELESYLSIQEAKADMMSSKIDLVTWVATKLWYLLGDIDTLDGRCRNNHMKFRERVRNTQQKRHMYATFDSDHTLKIVQTSLDSMVDRILYEVWNPICSSGLPWDEYETYVPEVVEFLKTKPSEEDLVSFLDDMAKKNIGVSGSPQQDRKAAQELLAAYNLTN